MTIDEVLRRREDQHLEFKSARSLAEPENIAREVVGMLNAEGGTIWIGIEDGEQGAAGPVDPVPNAERAKGRLLDYLPETIEPTPTSDELAIEVHQYGVDDRGLLEIRVHPPPKDSPRSPAAFVRKGGKHFVRRIDRRNHPMSREEIFPGRVSTTGDPAVDAARQKLLTARTAVRKSGGHDGLWVGLQPVRPLGLEIQKHKERFDQIALDPSVTGNRRAGWHFARTDRPPELTHQGLEWGIWSKAWDKFVIRTQITKDGGLEFWADLAVLHWRKEAGGEERELHPHTLLEMPISAFRIAREIYRNRLSHHDQVVADLALFGVGGWKLREGTPGTAGFTAGLFGEQEEPDLIWEPIPFRFDEIDETPDRCGFRLVRRVYHSFGIAEDDIPRQYDRETGKLILPE